MLSCPASPSRPLARYWVAALLALWVAGCGFGSNKTYPVQGRVVFKEDNRPLTGGTVLWKSVSDPNARASGEIGSDGTFTLSSSTGEGVVPGEYQVLIQPPIAEGGERGKATVPPRYQRVETSDLRYTVKPGENHVEIKLEKARR